MMTMMPEFGHTVADEVLDLLNSRHGCQETPLSSDGVVKDAGWNMLVNSMLLDSKFLFLYMPFATSGFFFSFLEKRRKKEADENLRSYCRGSTS